MINQNTTAKKVALAEGLKKQVNIAQIKEVQKCLLIELAKHSNEEITSLINRVARRYEVARPRG